MNRACTGPAAIAALGALCACGGHGGGGAAIGPPPSIVTAVFAGGGPTPVDGDDLLLFLSEDVTLVGGALLTDSDLVLSGNGTLGAVTAAPVLVHSRAVRIALGPGVAFVPGTTTVAFTAFNDAVRDTQGLFGNGGTPVTIGTSDGQAPVITQLTLSDVDGELNGTGPASGTLQVPQHSFTIDLLYSDNTGIDVAETLITADMAVSTNQGSQPAGTNLLPFLAAGTVNSSSASYAVPATTSFPQGAVSLTVTVFDFGGMASVAVSFPCNVRNYSDPVRPFETTVNASQVWFLDLSRDLESYTVDLGNPTTPVEVTAGSNARADLDDLLRVIGLHSATPILNVSGGMDSNQFVLERLRTALATELTGLHAGANVSFTFTPPPGSFGGQSSIPYNSFGYSRICIAGAADTGGQSGILGIALSDPNNGTQNDDGLPDFQGLRLGVFLHTIVNDGFKQSGASLFRQTFDPFTPARGGTAIGDDASDGLRLVGTLSDSRRTQIDTALAGLARFTAMVTAHECGHSVGLVRNGAMPAGLYGNDPVNFPGSNNGHIRNQSLFPAGAINVMSPSLSWSLALHPASAFNSLNLAYLRERVLYNN